MATSTKQRSRLKQVRPRSKLRPRKTAPCAVCGRRVADNTWGDSRLALTLRMLAIMPTTPSAGLTLSEMESELSVGRSKLFRLMKAFRRADLDVESCYAPSGVKVYYLPKQRQSLIDKILR